VRLALIILFSLAIQYSYCQDKIVSLQNDTIDCAIQKISNTTVSFTIGSSGKKMATSQIQSVYYNHIWYSREELIKMQVDNSTQLSESVMINSNTEPLSKKQKSEIYTGAVLIEKGTGKMVTGIVISLAGALVAE